MRTILGGSVVHVTILCYYAILLHGQSHSIVEVLWPASAQKSVKTFTKVFKRCEVFLAKFVDLPDGLPSSN